MHYPVLHDENNSSENHQSANSHDSEEVHSLFPSDRRESLPLNVPFKTGAEQFGTEGLEAEDHYVTETVRHGTRDVI